MRLLERSLQRQRTKGERPEGRIAQFKWRVIAFKGATMVLQLSLVLSTSAGEAVQGLSSYPGTTNTIMSLTLEQVIKMAVQKNLEIQIERYNPMIALANLKGLYGAYDPALGVSGQHSYQKAGSTLLQGTIEIPGQRSESDNISGSISGQLPIGTRYTLSLTATDTEGTRYAFDTNTWRSLSIPYSVGRGSLTLDVTQPLLKNLWIDSPRLNIRVAKNRLQYSQLTFKQRVMNIVTTVEQTYYDLIAQREYVRVQEKAVELAKQLVTENRKRAEIGAMTPLDVKQAEAQLAAAEADLISARNNLAIQEHALKKLIADKYSELADVQIEPSETLQAPVQVFDRQLSWARALTERPEILQAKLDLERLGVQLKYDRNQLFPELDVRVGGGYAGSTPEFSGIFGDIRDREQPFYYVGAQITLPIGNVAARNNYKATKLALEQAMLTLKRLERDIMAQVDDAIRQAESSYLRVAATRKAREYAEIALEAEMRKLEAGKSTTYTVTQMQRDLTAAMSSEVQALANYNKALSQLSFVEGTTLERLGINIQIE